MFKKKKLYLSKYIQLGCIKKEVKEIINITSEEIGTD